MNTTKSNRHTFGIVLLALCAFCAPVQGQAVAKMNAEALDAMKAGKWAEAHAVLVKATNTYDARALQLFGPRFGWFCTTAAIAKSS